MLLALPGFAALALVGVLLFYAGVLAASALPGCQAVAVLRVVGGQPRAELGEQAAVGWHAQGSAESDLAGSPGVAVGDPHLAGPASGGAVGREQLLWPPRIGLAVHRQAQ